MATADLMLGEWLPDIDLVFKVHSQTSQPQENMQTKHIASTLGLVPAHVYRLLTLALEYWTVSICC